MYGWMDEKKRYESASNRPTSQLRLTKSANYKNQTQEHLYIIGTYRCLTIKLLGISFRKLKENIDKWSIMRLVCTFSGWDLFFLLLSMVALRIGLDLRSYRVGRFMVEMVCVLLRDLTWIYI